MEYLNNTTIQILAICDTGNELLTISNYEWKINNVIQTENTETLLINTSSLPLGDNTISLRVQNSEPCNKWSEEYIQTITIVEATTMETTINIDVNQPTVVIDMVIPRTSTVTVNVKDNAGNPEPNVIVSTTEGITATSDANGVAVLNSVPYELNKPITGTYS